MNSQSKMQFSKKILALGLLVASGAGLVAPLSVAALTLGEIEALLDQSVPVNVTGGVLNLIAGTGVDETAIGNESIRTAVASAISESYSYLGTQINTDLEKKGGANISNFVNYGETLKRFYTSSALMAGLGVDSESLPDGKYQDLNQLFAGYIAMPINSATMSAHQASMLGVLQSRQGGAAAQARLQKDITRLVLGATSMFTSSISCAGINTNALENTAHYLAAASAGVLASEVNAASADFYRQMAKLGSPYSTPPFWALSLNSMAMEAEGRASQAATLEQISPGKKATKDINPLTGPEIVRSTNVIQNAQNQALGSMLNAGIIGGVNSIYGGSFSRFLYAIGAYYAQIAALKLAKALFGNIFNGTGLWAGYLSALGTVVAGQVTATFAKAVYDKLISVVFQGKLLGESVRCGAPASLTNFTSGANTTNIPSTGGGGEENVLFQVDPLVIVRGVSEPTVTLQWDASALGSGITVIIDEVGEGELGPFSASGSTQDLVDLTKNSQEYRLVIYRSGVKDETITPVSRTVSIINEGEGGGGEGVDFSAVTFAVSPTTLPAGGGAVTVTWDASSVPNAGLTITPLLLTGETLPLTGSRATTVTQTTTFTMVVVDITGDYKSFSQEVTVGALGSGIPVLAASTNTVQIGTDGLTLTVSGAAASQSAELWFNLGSGWGDGGALCTTNASGSCSKNYPASSFGSGEAGRTYQYYVVVGGKQSNTISVSFTSGSVGGAITRAYLSPVIKPRQ